MLQLEPVHVNRSAAVARGHQQRVQAHGAAGFCSRVPMGLKCISIKISRRHGFSASVGWTASRECSGLGRTSTSPIRFETRADLGERCGADEAGERADCSNRKSA